jgi:hypothetical protein
MVKSDAYSNCSAKPPDAHHKWLYQLLGSVFLSIISYSVYAEENPYDLPELGGTSHNHRLPTDKNFANGRKSESTAPANYLKQLTYRQLTESSAVYLAPRGVKLETEYSDNMTTELVAEGNGDITFTFKLSF